MKNFSTMHHDRDEAIEELVAQVADEFIEQMASGEDPSIEDYAERHPEAAAVIRRTLGALKTMRSVNLWEVGSDNDASNADSRPRTIGDFRLIRVVGRGGMGVVYEAEQLSLRRRVALKVLPYAAMLDGRALQRFRNEVTAAAQLDHPNIVPVHGVGCERGVHHYAMRLIEGVTLAEIIDQLRYLRDSGQALPDSIASISSGAASGLACSESELTPWAREFPLPPEKAGDTGVAPDTRVTRGSQSWKNVRQPAFYFRSVAILGATVAEALDHAHHHGIVHRDVKPSNILLDSAGKPWVADFGLAQVETGAAMTMTGDVLGTAKYMSPEQVQGKRVMLDHRTDVYSLGVTMYELLTLQLPFDVDNRQQLFRQILLDEPESPRKLNPAVPRELETIVLKAIEKSPDDRFVNAKELAEDLLRFLDHKPIHSRPATHLNRIVKWQRRHPALALSTTVVMLMAIICVSISAWLLGAKQKATAAALEAANNNLNVAMDALEQLLLQSVARRMRESPRLSSADREVLKSGLVWYAEFAETNQNVIGARFATAKAYGRVGEISMALDQRRYAISASTDGNANEAVEAFTNAIDQLEEMMTANANDEQYLGWLAYYHGERAKCLSRKSPEIADKAFTRAISLAEQLDKSKPRHQVILGENLRALAEHRIVTGRTSGVTRLLERSMRVFDTLLEKQPTTHWARSSHAMVHCRFGENYLRENDLQQASRHFRLAVDGFERLPLRITEPVPDGFNTLSHLLFTGEANRLLHDCYDHLGQILLKRNEAELAKDVYRREKDFWKRRCSAEPNNAMYLNRYAWFLATCPVADFRDPDAAIRHALMAVKFAPNDTGIWDTLSAAYCYSGDWTAVATPAEKSIHSEGEHHTVFVYLALAEWHVGDKERARHLLSKAVACLKESNETKLEFYRLIHEAAMTMEVGSADLTGGLYFFYTDQ